MLSIAATSLLFFLRIRAVYDTSKCVAFFFGFLWVAILGLSTLFMFAFHGGACMFNLWYRIARNQLSSQNIYLTHNAASSPPYGLTARYPVSWL